MPFTGSADNGSQRIEAAFSTQHGTTPIIPSVPPPGTAYVPENLRITGISRISVVVTQLAVSPLPDPYVPGPPSTVEVWISQRSQLPQDFRYLGTIIIGALGFPEVAEFHVAARLLQLRFQPALLNDAQYEWNVHGTGTS
jgi:hypothetical protein